MHNPAAEPAILTQQTILDSLPVAIIIVDLYGSIHYRNLQADNLFKRKLPVHTNLATLSSAFNDQDFLQAIKQLNNDPSTAYRNQLNFDCCNLPGMYQLKMVPYYEDNKLERSDCYLITLTSIFRESSNPADSSRMLSQHAVLKKNFKELKQFSRLSAMREMSTSLADQLNQPLTAILTYTQAMQRLYQSNASSEEISEAMERVVINAENAAQIIRNIRAQLKANTLQYQDAVINELILESIHLTELDSPSSKIKLISHFEPFSTALSVDIIQFKQMILNLLNNAIEALSESSVEAPEIIVSTKLNPLWYEITISDNGPGIPGKIQNKLFEPFFTTKENGIGIGLSICHHIIELHKGNISIDSGHKQPGTQVRICLPIQPR